LIVAGGLQRIDHVHASGIPEMLCSISRSCHVLPRASPNLAALHAAEALLYERTGTVAKTHPGLRAQFAHIARDESRIGQA
jgi:hypothetical protein